MIDFEKFIKAAYADGLSPEDFMREVAKAANKVSAEKTKDERDKLIATLRKQLELVKFHHYSLDDAVIVLTLAAVNQLNDREWTADTINKFKEMANNQVTNLISTFTQKNTADKSKEAPSKSKEKEKESTKETRQPFFGTSTEVDVKKLIDSFMQIFED